jgi:8-oxo-dGTP diphosphatase
MDAPAWPAIGVAAKAIVRRDDGRILVILRSPASHADPSTWDLPGGKMDYGETLTEVLVREAREETGLTVRPLRPIHITHFTKEPFWVTCVTVVCEHDAGEVHLSNEHVDHRWISVEEIPTLEYARAIREQLEAYASTLD